MRCGTCKKICSFGSKLDLRASLYAAPVFYERTRAAKPRVFFLAEIRKLHPLKRHLAILAVFSAAPETENGDD